jgi:hypothetical protein
VEQGTSVGSLYDVLLRSALRQFFDRAALDVVPSASARDHVSIEASPDHSALTIRWLGREYMLRVSMRWAFTRHEIRLAHAIGAVLEARYRALLNPRIIGERADLLRGPLEDRYVGAFLDPQPYAMDAEEVRADRIALVIELLRVAALSSYENRPISTGVLLLGTKNDPCRPHVPAPPRAPWFTEQLTSIKSFYRLADGVRTVFLANSDGQLIDIIDLDRWGTRLCEVDALTAPCAQTYQPHARATLGGHGHVCAVLSPSREIKVFAEGAELFAFRDAAWHLLDLEAKYGVWARAVVKETLANRLFQTALDLADARHGALFVVLHDPARVVAELVVPTDRLDVPGLEEGNPDTPSRRDLLHLLEGRSATELDPSVLAALASLDGATVVDGAGRLLAAGAILRHPPSVDLNAGGVVEGARTTAALAASRYGPVLKVSEDGVITFFEHERIWDI